MNSLSMSLDVVRHNLPFTWYEIRRALDSAAASELFSTFPTDGFQQVGRSDAEKSYEMWVRKLHPDDGVGVPLSRSWASFVTAVTAPRVRADLTKLTGLNVAGRAEVNLWRYSGGSWLSPHVDKPEKLLTIVIYLNPDWPEGAGGNLLILNSSSMDDISTRVRPELNTGVILIPTEDSWHAVEPVTNGTVRERASVQVIFYREETS